MAANSKGNFDEIDEAEEEALLKSDDESDTSSIKEVDPQGASSEKRKDAMRDNETDTLDSYDSNAAGSDKDAKNDKEDDDSDYDDDDDDDSKSTKVLTEYNKILKEIEKQPYEYEKYMQLCQLSHSTDDLECIRKSYNMFASVYPLSPDLWLKYLSIEKNVALSPTEIKYVEGLFRRALADYYSFDLALEFAALASRSAEAEKIWNEVLGTYGLECMRGQELFKSYRQYLVSHPNLSPEEKDARYIESFVRELVCPLKNMEESYIEFKVFCEKNKDKTAHIVDWDKLDQNYFQAKDHLQKILPFEEHLQKIDIKCYRERADVYIEYIKASDKFLEENVLQTVYERMVTDCCLNPECWLIYIDFVAYRDEYGRPAELKNLPIFQQGAIEINRRALRNCVWSDKLYIKLMQLLEMKDASREEVQEVLENSMSAGFQTPEPVVAIWLEYLTYLRRHTDWENESECDILRKNFNLAWTILGQQWGVLADCNCEILQFWGRLEYGPLRDPQRGKELWTTVMDSSDNATKSGIWIEFSQLEMKRDLEATRRLYHKALNIVGLDNASVIASAWQRFERCNGTIKSLTACLKECTIVSNQCLARQANPGANVEKFSKVNKKPVKRKSDAIAEVADAKKVKPQRVEENKQELSVPQRRSNNKRESEFRAHETQEIDLTKDHLRIFLSNLDYNLSEDDIREHLGDLKIVNIDLIRAANGRSRGFGYMEMENEAEVEKALAMDRRTVNGRPLFISSVLRDKEKREKFKYSGDVEPKKLFVKGLPHDTTKEELEQIFSRYGQLQDVRLVYHKSGNFKNIAYVEFKEENAAGKAVLGSNQLDMRGHRINVAISAPPPKIDPPTINSEKLLGVASRRSKTDQKPRMTLIPSVVRKKFTSATAPSANGVNFQGKTNADFRSLLQKKN